MSLDPALTGLQDIKQQLLAWDGAISPDDMSLLEPFRIPMEIAPHLRSYLLGLVSGRLGEVSAARAYAEEIRGGRTMPDSAALIHDLAQEIDAQALLSRGDFSDGLAALEQVQLNTRWAQMIVAYMFSMRPYGRLLRAELLRRLNREQEALDWYRSLGPRTPVHFWAPAISHRPSCTSS